MAKKIINIGAKENDRSGDPIRTAFNKINDNFTELYTGMPLLSVGATPPPGPHTVGEQWWDSTDGNSYIWYDDTWVPSTSSVSDQAKNVRTNTGNSLNIDFQVDGVITTTQTTDINVAFSNYTVGSRVRVVVATNSTSLRVFLGVPATNSSTGAVTARATTVPSVVVLDYVCTTTQASGVYVSVATTSSSSPSSFSGSYFDLTDQPSIPADISDLTDTENLLGSGSGGTPGSSFIWRGAWDPQGSYVGGQDVVSSGGGSYIKIGNGNSGSYPQDDSARWSPVAIKGADGAPGTNGVGFTPKGAWSDSLNYAVNDVVTYDGSSYVCIFAVSSGTNVAPYPQNIGSYWNLIASKGADSGSGDRLINGLNELVLGTDGAMTAPYGKLGVAPGEVFGIVADESTAVTIQSDGGTQIWSFDTNGTTTFPNALLSDGIGGTTLGSDSGFVIASPSAVTLETAGGLGQLNLTQDAGTTSGRLDIFFQNTLTGALWTFDEADKSLTFPDGLSVKDSVIGYASSNTTTQELPEGIASQTITQQSQIEIDDNSITIARRTINIVNDTVTTSNDEEGSSIQVDNSGIQIKTYSEPEGPDNSVYIQFRTTSGATMETVAEGAMGSGTYGRVTAGSDAVEISTRDNGVDSAWLFYNDGVLTLPEGGTITNTQGGIKLATSRGTLALGTEMEAPTDSNHFHIAFDGSNNMASTNALFLGDDYNYVKINSGRDGVAIGTGSEFIPVQNWSFGTNGTLALPNGAVVRSSTNSDVTGALTAYNAAIAAWEFNRINDYMATVNAELVTIEGWPFAGWDDVSGTTAAAYLAIVNNAYNIQNNPSSPPQSLIFIPAISSSLRAQLASDLQAVINTYATWQALVTSVDIVAGSETLSLLSNNKIQVPGIIQTDVEEDIIIRARYAGATSPSGTTTVNQDFVFGTNGSLTMPNSGSITTTHLNTNFLNYQTNGTLQVGHEGGGNVIVATDRFQVLSKVPTSSKGSAGDAIGCVAFDATYIYYCSGLYNGTTDIWHRVVWTDNVW